MKKQYFDSYLAKKFIQASLISTSCKYYLLKNQEKKSDFLLIIKDSMLL